MTAQATTDTPAVHPIDRLYRTLAGDRFLLLVLVLVGLALLVSLLLPQVPPGLDRPDGTNRWLAETGARYGEVGGLLRQAGLFAVRQSLWFRILLGLLAFVLLLRFAQSLREAIVRLGRPDAAILSPPADRWPLHAHLELAGDVATAQAELVEDLQLEGWHVAAVAVPSGARVTAERSRWGLMATPLLYGGLLVVLAALWLGQVLGWQEADITLVPGEQTHLSRDQALLLGLDVAADGAMAVVVQQQDGPAVSYPFSARGTVSVAGVTIHRTGEGLALGVSAQDPDGDPLQLQPLEEQSPASPNLSLVFDQPRAERVFLVPARQLAFSIVAFPALPERGFTGPTFLVQAFQVGQREPLFNEFVQGDAAVTVAGDTYQLHSGQFVTVQASRNPGMPLLVAGLAIAVAGVLLSLGRPAGRLHLQLRGQRNGVAVVASLQPSRAWRQARRWFAAWKATYGEESGT